jgi:RNA polymerase sigma factor (sigma-70 family)
MRADDDATLLRACRDGDAEAWELLVRRYQRLIYAIARRSGLSEELAGEVFQRVCMSLLKYLPSIEQPERLGAWLATTTRRETWRLLRQENRVPGATTDEEEAQLVMDNAPLPDEVFERIERQATVRRALGEIDERCRTLLTLLFYRAEPAPYSEIAAAIGVPEGSIGPTRARCLQKLQRALEKYDW